MHAPAPSRTESAHLAAEPNVTPMIDVLLVLLIVFMMLVSVRQAITAHLPPAADASSAEGAPPLVLTVEAGPRYTLNRQPVPPAALGATLSALFAPRPEKVLFIAGHRGATYQDVIGAMDAARGAGVRVIGIAPRTVTSR